MVITLDNGQVITVYEDGNLLREIQLYIDKEIYDLLENAFGSVEADLERLDKLEDEMVDKDEAYDTLDTENSDLKDKYDDLYEENKELESTKDKILNEIEDIVDKSRSNKLAFDEVENMLEKIWEEN